jgi:Spy/CpxP family protein refolding chaperone
MHRSRSPKILVSLFALAAWLLAGTAAARPPGPPPDGGPGGRGGMQEGRLERLVEELALEESTRVAVDAVLDTSRVRGREIRRRLRAAHDEMRALLESAEPDEATIFAQVDTISALEAEVEKNRLGTLIRVRALLSDEAREQLLKSMQRGPPDRSRRRERRPPDGPR